MNDDTRSLTELLQRAAPDPAIGIDFDMVAARVRRRRRAASWLVGSGAVLAVGLAFAGSAVLTGGDDRAREAPPVAAGSDSPSAGSTAPAPGCPPTKPYPDGKRVDIDYVPFIQIGSQQFIAQLDGVPPLARSDLREQVATVTCRIADLTESGREGVVGGFLDGNAAYLVAGTPVYAVAWYDPGCRVAAIQDGVIDVYLAHHEVNDHSVPTDCALKEDAAQKAGQDGGVRATVPTHCGVLSVTVNGQLWLADPTLGDHNPPPGWDENQTAGTFTKTGPGTATFRTDDGQRAEFRLAEPGMTDPNVGCE